jgi:hypothetical protein
MTIPTNHEENDLMDQHDDNSGEQTDSGISSTFTNDMEQMFAETVNNVINKDFLLLTFRIFVFFFLVSS